MYRKIFSLTFVLVLLCTVTTWAAIPKGLVDSTPDKAVLINYNDWYTDHSNHDNQKMVSETIFSSPRATVMLRDAGIGFAVGNHYHATCDEIVLVMGGSGEILINGEWKAVKATDVHVNPRGIIHNTRVLGNQSLQFISIFTPPQPTSGDANVVQKGENVTIAKGLISSKPDKAVLVNFDEWYAKYKAPNDPKIVSETTFTSPRSIVMLRTAGKGSIIDSHFHATCDEIVVVLSGTGEMLLNDEWIQVKSGDVHVNPRGIVHATRVLGNEDLRFVSIFTPPQPAGGDMNILK